MEARIRVVGVLACAAAAGSVLFNGETQAQGSGSSGACAGLPGHADLRAALRAAVGDEENGGLGNDMWATVVDRDGVVCQVAFTGDSRGDQWPGSRVISAQKANTANAFSRPGNVMGFAGALSTANLYSVVQPGQSLFGLQESNPVNPAVAYQGNPGNYGRSNDPLRGERVGGVNVFGGGLALYDAEGVLLGGLGVSGDTSCTDHIVAWKTRFALNLDNVPAGVSPTGDDNIIHDLTRDSTTGHTVSASGFGHPTCDEVAMNTAEALPEAYPVGGAAPE